MKKITLMLAVVLVGSVVFGQSNQVLSRNAVGYVKVTAPRGNFALVRNDFNMLTGDPTASNLFGLTTFPTGTVLYIYDAAASQYNYETLASNKANKLHWGPNTNLITPGQGFWIKVHEGAPSNDYTAFMMGEVPDRFTSPTATVYILEGYNLIGYPYPAEVFWTNTELAKAAVTGDTLYTYTPSGYEYNQFASNKAQGLHWQVPTQILHVGQGYWFKRRTGASGVQWDEPKPYTWP